MSAIITYGITGNWYCYSTIKSEVEAVADKIGKARSSIRFYDKTLEIENLRKNTRIINKVYAFRVKDKKMKTKLKEIQETPIDRKSVV